ncbi:MAG: LysR family transcriptional regulator [Solobacterium sp.]|nr:LysR family transcriptional regulator [Solobacterium sp.]
MEQEMNYIYTIYECGSFSRAAEKLYMTQPALSIAVRRVEERLGTQLFDRSARTLKLTQAGEIYIRKYRQIRDLELEMSQEMQDLSSLRTGTLHLGGTNYINSYILPDVLVKFHAKYPGIELQITEDRSDRLLNLVKEHRVDLSVNCGVDPKEPFLHMPGFTDHILLCIPKSFVLPRHLRSIALTNTEILQKKHLDPECPAVRLSSFQDLPMILLLPGNNLHARTLAMFEEDHAVPNIIMESGQLATAWHLSCAGMAMTMISDHLVTPSSDSVLFFRIDSPLAVRHFELILSDRRYISKAMQAFADIFREEYAEA